MSSFKMTCLKQRYRTMSLNKNDDIDYKNILGRSYLLQVDGAGGALYVLNTANVQLKI